jgi:hypothetical protein
VAKPNALDRPRRWLVGIYRKASRTATFMEARLGKKGKREYVQTLRLLETFNGEVAGD